MARALNKRVHQGQPEREVVGARYVQRRRSHESQVQGVCPLDVAEGNTHRAYIRYVFRQSTNQRDFKPATKNALVDIQQFSITLIRIIDMRAKYFLCKRTPRNQGRTHKIRLDAHILFGRLTTFFRIRAETIWNNESRHLTSAFRGGGMAYWAFIGLIGQRDTSLWTDLQVIAHFADTILAIAHRVAEEDHAPATPDTLVCHNLRPWSIFANRVAQVSL